MDFFSRHLATPVAPGKQKIDSFSVVLKKASLGPVTNVDSVAVSATLDDTCANNNANSARTATNDTSYENIGGTISTLDSFRTPYQMSRAGRLVCLSKKSLTHPYLQISN